MWDLLVVEGFALGTYFGRDQMIGAQLKDDGIGPMKLLLDKLSTINSLRFPKLFGISP